MLRHTQETPLENYKLMYSLLFLKNFAKYNLVGLIWLISGYCAIYFRFDGNVQFHIFIKLIPSVVALTLLYAVISQIDRKLFGTPNLNTFEDFMSTVRQFLGCGLLYFIFLFIYPSFILPKSYPILSSILALGLYLLSKKFYVFFAQWLDFKSRKIPIAIYGAGSQAIDIMNKIQNQIFLDWKPIVILDDNPDLAMNTINGIKIIKGQDLESSLIKYKPRILIIAFSNFSNMKLETIEKICGKHSIQLRIISPMQAISGNELKMSDIRRPSQEELIGKSSIKIEIRGINEYLRDKIILVTGAGGSIGSEICRQVSLYSPKKIYMLDRDETGLLNTMQSIYKKPTNVEYILADIRDESVITQIWQEVQPEIVFHAAALKHLNMLEKYPEEAIKTNIIGTNIVLNESHKEGVKVFVNISSDKAADPISVLGKTKLVSEKLTAEFARKTPEQDSKFISVRFGNVFGSRGSVIQTFQERISRNEPIIITNPKVARYFMTVEEAVHLVLRATIEGKSGDTLVLKMGNLIFIKDLAEKLIQASGKNIEIQYSALLPGEKLEEVLIGVNEVPLKSKSKELIRVKVKPINFSEIPLNYHLLNNKNLSL